jgi:peptidyl-dipeptidase A
MRLQHLALCAIVFAFTPACGKSKSQSDDSKTRQATPATTLATTPAGDMTKQPKQGADPARVSAFVTAQVDLFRPLQIEAGKTWYAASISGTDEDFAASEKADNALNSFKADSARFAEVRALRDAGPSGDALADRQLELLYLGMLGKQVDETMLTQITALEKQVEKLFNTYRATVGKKALSQNEIEAILSESTDSAKLQAAWEGQKGVGPVLAPKLLELVGLRNQVAKKLGFRDYYAMRLAESELDEQTLLALFDKLDELTREPFLKAKQMVDTRLAKRLKVSEDQLMPWHYQNPFFQEPPNTFDTGLDALYKKQDVVALSSRFYNGIGLPAEDIVTRSDLYEKPGKSPHAFAIDIDREGDTRVLCNVVPGLNWQTTMVHELGHAVYDKFTARDLPWLLREATHPLTTEGIAMMFDYLVSNPMWPEAMGLMDEQTRAAAMDEARAYQAFAELQFSRWTQVMLRFEREMYRDPTQDLNTLWWDLVERYQGLHRPPGRNAPDYASKIHLVVSPVYYQNYMLGKLFAAQVHEAIAEHVAAKPEELVYVDDPRVGKFLVDKVFGPGARYDWNGLTRHATGKDLAPDAFARRF